MVITCYFKLRSKQLFRLLKGIGLVRSLFLLGLLFLILFLLVKTDKGWITPTVVISGLLLYHNGRKDKDFLWLRTDAAVSILRMEYLLLGLPFILMEVFKANFLGAGAMVLAALLLPHLKTVQCRMPVIPLPFLYKGGLEYIRMFRMYGWVYLFLFVVSFIGGLHQNVRIAKAFLMVWCVLQSAAFLSVPRRHELAHFRSFSFFQGYLVRSGMWNVAVTGLPWVVMILSFSLVGENVLFSACALAGSVLYLWNLGMARYLLASAVALAIYQLVILIPLFFYACFVPFLLIAFILINAVCYILLKNDSKKIWN